MCPSREPLASAAGKGFGRLPRDGDFDNWRDLGCGFRTDPHPLENASALSNGSSISERYNDQNEDRYRRLDCCLRWPKGTDPRESWRQNVSESAHEGSARTPGLIDQRATKRCTGQRASVDGRRAKLDRADRLARR